ncbi:FkbM family methyltransferase [Mycobacterium deserti]|uniref:FkbM family methyltransferase n=1 Tax=Mycobacterium deserti TaxID=2978347 RepID=A0ABT2M3K4_9MYCO|nr:FkbM family methyltransferase [Mycobacterium deserti]MCT7656847.1 FkbM family methyltransferase [Mycobacterium deserti]
MSAGTAVKQRLAPVAKAVAPGWFWRRKFDILSRLVADRDDMRLICTLCDPARVSVDIGADVGEFSIAMASASKSVIAFEPRRAQARDLEAMFRAAQAPVDVRSVALSAQAGTIAMRVVASDPGRSTIEGGNPLADEYDSTVETIDVPVQRLDDLGLENVGCIKVDVEGHELAVLQGAVNTIRRSRPALLIEAEERHHPNAVAEITALLTDLGYRGYFIDGDARRPIAEFDVQRHQNPANIGGWRDGWSTQGTYVNNFVFLPSD